MNLRHFMRMSKWARHPLSKQRVLLVAIVIGLCLALVLVERLIGWPDWLTVNTSTRGSLLK